MTTIDSYQPSAPSELRTALDYALAAAGAMRDLQTVLEKLDVYSHQQEPLEAAQIAVRAGCSCALKALNRLSTLTYPEQADEPAF